jgi:hypothetical protein
MNGEIREEPCGCYAVWVDGKKISTHKKWEDAESALINAYLLYKTKTEGEQ